MTVTLYHGDCLEVMRGLPDASVDAVVTDPPYGIGYTYNGEREEARTPAEYWAWFRPFHADMLRVLKPGGFLAMWQTQLYFPYFWEWFGPDIHIYCAAKNFVQLRKTPINYAYDPVVMTYKHGTPLRPLKPKRNVDYFVANTAALVSDPTRIERAHPTPKPIDLMTAVVDNFTLPGGVVLDPFTGSGSTGVAAVNTGRDFIGIERDAGYFAIAEKRIEQAQTAARQLTLEGIA